MDTVATGRIAFWEGGSLWAFDVPTGADAPDRIAKHAHHAYQLAFSLGGDFSLHLEDGVTGGPFAIVAPNVPHAFEAQGLISLLFTAMWSPIPGFQAGGQCSARPLTPSRASICCGR